MNSSRGKPQVICNSMTNQFKDFPHDGQKRSETSTGFPQRGQKPADLFWCALRRATIMDSRSSSVRAEALADASARRAATASSMRSALIPRSHH
jgi:hypothetical protein